MNIRNLIAILSCSLILISCATVQLEKNEKHGYDFNNIKSLTILPFLEVRIDSIIPNNAGQRHNYIIADELAMALLGSGIKIVDRNIINRILSEQKLTLLGLMKEQDYVKIGKLTNADAILYGVINTENAYFRRQATISVKIIDVRTGETVFTVLTKSGDSWGQAERLVNPMAKEIASTLRDRFSLR